MEGPLHLTNLGSNARAPVAAVGHNVAAAADTAQNSALSLSLLPPCNTKKTRERERDWMDDHLPLPPSLPLPISSSSSYIVKLAN